MNSWGGGERGPVDPVVRAELAPQEVFTKALRHQQGGSDPGIPHQGHQQLGHIQQGGSPGDPAALGSLQQIFQGISDVKLRPVGAGLVGTEALQPIQQPVWIEGQGIQPAVKAPLRQQGLQQVLHVHRAMAPAASSVLGSQEQLPAVIAEAIGVAGEAWGHGLGDQPGAEIWISSTL